MYRLALVGILSFTVVLGCAHNPQAPAAAEEMPEETPAPALTPEEEETAEVLRRYTWHDDWLDNFPVLNGITKMTELLLVNMLKGLADLPPMGPSAPAKPTPHR
jgi:hypothetical protein